jgi:hypothetical protein
MIAHFKSRGFRLGGVRKAMSDFNPTPENQNVVLVDATTLRKVEKLVICCEGCNPVDAELPFKYVLDRVTGNDPEVTDYIMVECAAKCPQCQADINEKTLVRAKPVGRG